MPWLERAVLVVERGMTGATGNLYCGLHEFADMALLLHYFGGGPGLFLDVGANVGSYTILAAKVCHAKVVAVEPAPLAFGRLLRNLEANQIGSQVEAHQAAVGAAPGTLRFSTDCDTTNQVVDLHYQGEASDVPVTTLDALTQGNPANFWKVDVEGFEEQVLQGATRALADPTLEVVLLEGSTAWIHEVMTKHGFIERCYMPIERRLGALEEGSSEGNHVWIRNQSCVEARCQAAPVRKLHGVKF